MWLSLETSSPRVSMALGKEGRCLREVEEYGNASTLIEPLCRRLAPDFSRITLCVIGQGPGSYNGLRVGYAFLKGLLCTAPIPVLQIPTPLILARMAVPTSERHTPPSEILVLNNARRGEVYGALVEVRGGIPRLLWETVAPEAILRARLPSVPIRVASYDYPANGLPSFSEEPFHHLFPSASAAGILAHDLKGAASSDLACLQPHYVRDAVPFVKK